MKHTKLFAGILILLITINSYGQKTIKKRLNTGKYIEEFYVLKENTTVKDGQYLKFVKDENQRRIPVEYGFFDTGNRIGEWYFFHANGALAYCGNYSNEGKQGIWTEYYDPLTNDEKSMFASFELEMQSPLKIDRNNNINIEIKETNISATGVYESNKKTGPWTYYNRQGELVHRYDHSLEKLLFSSLPDTVDLNFPYLGGRERFYEKYISAQEAYDLGIFLISSSAVFSLAIDESQLRLERIHSEGDEKNILIAENIIKFIPNDWIISYFQEPIQLIWKFRRESSDFSIILDFGH